MKMRHDGDCSIYVSLDNQRPEAGICTCGYGHQLTWQADYSEMYSKELEERLEEQKMSDEENNCVISRLEKDIPNSLNPEYLRGIMRILMK
jgi:hypothetical protein